jgi:hypothetical protein
MGGRRPVGLRQRLGEYRVSHRVQRFRATRYDSRLMTPYEKDLFKIGAEAAMLPFRDIMEKIFGLPAAEAGEVLRDILRNYRFRITLGLLEKVKTTTERLGIHPQQVPIKILLPLLEQASLEDDEDLHKRWAALLVNAADPRQDHSRIPSFVRILEQMSREDVIFVDALYNYVHEHVYEHGGLNGNRVFDVAFPGHPDFIFGTILLDTGLSTSKDPHLASMTYHVPENPALIEKDQTAIAIIIDNLIRLRLVQTRTLTSIEPVRKAEDLAEPKLKETTEYYFTALGCAFVNACREPPGATT